MISCNSNTNYINHDNLPNIILIMGDDIGFSDIGAYGSEINTPHLDRLAEGGMRFTRFYNMSKCEATRSTMLTGLYYGDSTAHPMSSYLKKAGYTTIMAGKQHFYDWVPGKVYAENSFDHSLVYDKINSFFIPPSGKFENPFFLNGKELDIAQVDTGSTPFYKTNFLTDYALNVMEEEINNERPFFLYLPYHTAHYPLQALPEDIEKYRGTYKKGWDVLRQERFERMKKMGIIPRHTVLSPPEDNINKFRGHPKGDEDIRANIPKYRFWDSLSNKEQDDLDLEMAVFAAMVDCMDQNIGRIISKLEETGQLDNTLIIYLSDNGSCPYDSNRDFEVPPGPANSYRTLSAAWANTGNTPFRLFKQFGHSGGSQTQFIVHWPGQVEKGTLTNQTGHVVDIFPTFLDLINRMDPSMGKPPYPLDGTSLLPVFEGKTRKVPEYMVSGMEKFRMYQRDNYKLVRANNENWELYDMDKDPTEINNLAADMPEKVIEMDSLYIEWTKTHKKRR